MMDSFKDKLSGKAKQVAGNVIGNDKLKTEGKFEDAKKKVDKTLDEAKEKHEK